jgi:hypothetical protein
MHGDERERSTVYRDRLDPRQVRGAEGHDELDDPEREKEPTGAAGDGEEKALGEKPAHEPSAPRPERGTHRELTLPFRRSRGKEVGDVGADDEQHESDRAHEHHQPGTLVFHEKRLHRRHRRSMETGVVLGEPLRRSFGDGIQLLVGRLDRCASREPAHRPQVMGGRVVELVVRERERDEELYVGIGKAERRREDAHDGHGAAVELHALSERLERRRVAALPVSRTEEHDGVVPLRLLPPRKASSEDGLDAEERKEVRRDPCPGDALGLPLPHEVEAGLVPRRDCVEEPALAPESEELGRGERRERSPAIRSDEVEGARVRVRKRFEDDLLDDAEDGGIRSDPEREHRGRHQRETGPPQKRAKTEDDVLEYPVHDPTVTQASCQRGSAISPAKCGDRAASCSFAVSPSPGMGRRASRSRGAFPPRDRPRRA